MNENHDVVDVLYNSNICKLLFFYVCPLKRMLFGIMTEKKLKIVYLKKTTIKEKATKYRTQLYYHSETIKGS